MVGRVGSLRSLRWLSGRGEFRPPAVSETKSASELLQDAASYSDEKSEEAQMWSTSPYPKGADVNRCQAARSLRPTVDPASTTLILFPGQGTQYVGMASSLQVFPAAVDLFDQASSILKYDLLKLCLNGPATKLNQTVFAQPAIFVSSLAALEKLKEERPSAVENCVATAGFSLGEITALVFSNALSFEQAVKLVKVRAEAMQAASEMYQGAMATVLYRPDTKLGAVCAKAKEYAESLNVPQPYCGIANYLFPQCKIIAGSEEAIQYLENNKEELKLKRVKRLAVSGAFHTPHMLPAVEVFRAALAKTQVNDPMLAVHSNVDGHHYRDAHHIKKQLPKQITSPVKWEQTLHVLYERPPDSNFPTTYEVGPGEALKTTLKMVNMKAHVSCLSVPA